MRGGVVGWGIRGRGVPMQHGRACSLRVQHFDMNVHRNRLARAYLRQICQHRVHDYTLHPKPPAKAKHHTAGTTHPPLTMQCGRTTMHAAPAVSTQPMRTGHLCVSPSVKLTLSHLDPCRSCPVPAAPQCRWRIGQNAAAGERTFQHLVVRQELSVVNQSQLRQRWRGLTCKGEGAQPSHHGQTVEERARRAHLTATVAGSLP